MNDFENVVIDRPILPLCFMVDYSGSMSGSKIGAVNSAIRETLSEMKSNDIGGADADIEMNVLTFGAEVDWLYKGLVSVNDIVWNDISAAGLTPFGEALRSLKTKLSKNEFMSSFNAGKVFKAPVIILLTDGAPTDEWKEELKQLKENRWFKVAIKIAIAIGEEPNIDVLEAFTGTSEAVLEVHNRESLKKLIRLVTITSSMVGSKSSGELNPEGSETAKVAEEIQTVLSNDVDFTNDDDDWD